MDSDANRLFLQNLLETTFPSFTIYYRPPGNILLNYPCIVYERKAYEPSFANSSTYTTEVRYQVMFISKLPGDSNVQNMFNLHGQGLIIGSNDSYENDDLVHDVFTVFVNSYRLEGD